MKAKRDFLCFGTYNKGQPSSGIDISWATQHSGINNFFACTQNEKQATRYSGRSFELFPT